jgi:ATP-dependent RNA helicase DeaD
MGMERFRIEVGHQHEVKPGNIVGAIANEAGLDAQHIGHIDIQTEYSLVDLPIGMPREVFQDLRKARVCGQRLDIALLDQQGTKPRDGARKPVKKKKATRTMDKGPKKRGIKKKKAGKKTRGGEKKRKKTSG